MKKITLLILSLMAFNLSNAQDTCATAAVATAGTTVVAAVDGTDIPLPECAANAGGARTAGEWYIYTAVFDGVVNITTDLAVNAGGDTRVHIYTGTCGLLTCVAGNDDVDGTNYLSDVTFAVTNGTSYYIAWDDRWSPAGFDFLLTETAVDCSTTFPYAEDFADINTFLACFTTEDANADGTGWGFNNGNDLDGDGTNDNFVTIFPGAAGIAKDDWVYAPAFTGVANSDYTITLIYNSFDNPAVANETLEIVALDSPSSTAGTQSVLGTFTGITQSGLIGDTGGNDLITQAYSSQVTYTPTVDGDFYIGVHATTLAADSGLVFILNLNVDETLGVEEFESNTFSHFYNKDTKDLTLESSGLPLENIEMYNILGQNVMSKNLSQTTEVMNLSSLKDGIYLAKISIKGQTQTIKILKQ